jgi:hypothetical protein
MIVQEAEMEKKARSVAQDAAIYNRVLDGIWRLGDRDECSIKHIGWATAAIGAGLDWSDGLDYNTPWPTPFPEDMNPWEEKLLAQKRERLSVKWAKVVKYRDTFGIERFDQMMRSTKFNWYYESFLPDMQATK